MDLPIEDGRSFHNYVSVYQRIVDLPLQVPMFHSCLYALRAGNQEEMGSEAGQRCNSYHEKWEICWDRWEVNHFQEMVVHHTLW